MLVSALRVEIGTDEVVRSARVTWAGGDRRVSIAGPRGVVDESDDASGWLTATLMAAMTWGEDLVVRGPVSPRLLGAVRRLSTAYERWDPTLRRPDVHVDEVQAPRTGGPGFAAFFSRGADSTFSAALDRAPGPPLTHLVFVDGLEPLHSAATAAEEIRRARSMAGLLELPLVLLRTDLRTLTEHRRDWSDVNAGVLAAIAHAVGPMAAAVLVPPSAGIGELTPFGSHPVLDGELSTEAVEVVHDDCTLDRIARVGILARDRPDLLADLKVCHAEDRPDNCGRCDKCLMTMSALHAAGALPLASQFPDRLDPEVLRHVRPHRTSNLVQWEHAMRALGPGPERDAIADALRRSARPGPRERAVRWLRSQRQPPGRFELYPMPREPSFAARFHGDLRSLMRRGEVCTPTVARRQPPAVAQQLRARGSGEG